MSNRLIFIGNAFEREKQISKIKTMPIMWTRQELTLLFNIYGRFVARGEWRDYGISATHDRAVFAIFRKSHEAPLYRIEKMPHLQKKQELYHLTHISGRIIRRGQDLAQLLKFFDKRRLHLAT